MGSQQPGLLWLSEVEKFTLMDIKADSPIPSTDVQTDSHTPLTTVCPVVALPQLTQLVLALLARCSFFRMVCPPKKYNRHCTQRMWVTASTPVTVSESVQPRQRQQQEYQHTRSKIQIVVEIEEVVDDDCKFLLLICTIIRF